MKDEDIISSADDDVYILLSGRYKALEFGTACIRH
jgi:hypothetical protein